MLGGGVGVVGGSVGVVVGRCARSCAGVAGYGVKMLRLYKGDSEN